MTMARYVRGNPIMEPYLPASSYNAGDVIVIGGMPMVAHNDNPVYANGSLFQDNLAAMGGVYQMAADAAYANGTYVWWNAGASQISSGSAGNVPFGWIIGGPLGRVDDGGPTGAASLCHVLHDPMAQLGGLSGNVVETAITTVGAGSLTAAALAGRQILRTGSTTAFTDTTVTAAALVAVLPGLAIGKSFEVVYKNSTVAVATLTGGTGIAGAAAFATVGPGAWIALLFTYTAANTFTVTQRGGGDNWLGLPSTSCSTGTTATTFTAAEMTGGKLTIYTSTAATPGSLATATAAAMFAAIQGAYVGLKWIFRVINDVATNSLTVTADASVTLSGKTTYVATPFGSMDFEITFTSPTAATMKYIGGGQSTTV